MRLHLDDFDMETSWDYIRIYNGNSTSGNLIARETGNSAAGEKEAAFYSSSNQMLVRLTTDGSVRWDGFNAHYMAVPECGTAANPRRPSAAMDVSRVFHDPAGPNSTYAANRGCHWLIEAQHGTDSAEPSFDAFATETGWDLLRIAVHGQGSDCPRARPAWSTPQPPTHKTRSRS